MAALSEFSTGTAQLELAKKTTKNQPCVPLNQANFYSLQSNQSYFSQIKLRHFLFSLHQLSTSLKLNDQHKFILSLQLNEIYLQFMKLLDMLFVHFKLVKMCIDLLCYITAIQLPFKSSKYSIIQIPIRILEYQFWYSLPSLIFTFHITKLSL